MKFSELKEKAASTVKKAGKKTSPPLMSETDKISLLQR